MGPYKESGMTEQLSTHTDTGTHTQATHTHTLLPSAGILDEEYKECSGWVGLGYYGLLRWFSWIWKESPCSAGDWVQSLGWEDSLEKGMATHSSILFFFFFLLLEGYNWQNGSIQMNFKMKSMHPRGSSNMRSAHNENPVRWKKAKVQSRVRREA